ncbi:MAG: LysR family transcriptional regulator [Gammaproteobacteria bacterium]
MEYSSLRTFVTVAREGNLSRAAERLFLSQPALSLQMKKLQEELGLRLFERSAHGMRLTDAGQSLLPAAERALNAAGEFMAAAAGLEKGVTGRLRLGTIIDPEFLRLGRFLGILAERHPGLAFELKHGMSGTVARLVEDGQLDVAYTLGQPDVPDLREHLHAVCLTNFHYHVVGPPGWGHRLKGKGWRELAALPWIGTPPDSVHNKLLSRIFAAEGVEQNAVALVDLEPSMLDLVQSGVGLTLVRHSLALEAAHTHGVVIADAVSINTGLCFVCRPERLNEPPIKAAMEAIEEVWGH